MNHSPDPQKRKDEGEVSPVPPQSSPSPPEPAPEELLPPAAGIPAPSQPPAGPAAGPPPAAMPPGTVGGAPPSVPPPVPLVPPPSVPGAVPPAAGPPGIGQIPPAGGAAGHVPPAVHTGTGPAPGGGPPPLPTAPPAILPNELDSSTFAQSVARRRKRRQGPQIVFALGLCGSVLFLIVLLAVLLPGNNEPVARNSQVSGKSSRPGAAKAEKPRPEPLPVRPAPKSSPTENPRSPDSAQQLPGPKPAEPMPENPPEPSPPPPQPKPTPPPAPPRPTPKPQSQKPPGKAPSASQAELQKQKEAELLRLLMATRYELGHRNLDTAKALLKRAEAMAQSLGDSPAARQYRRVALLAGYVEQFWQAVQESIKQLQSLDQVKIDGKIVGVVEVTPRRLTLRVAGRNRTYTLQNMPTGLAFGLAQRWLDKSQGSTYLVLGAYYAVDPKNRKERARALWEQAARMGLSEDVNLLLPELKIAVPTASPLTAPAGASLARTTDGRWQLPPQRRLASLKSRWKGRYQNALDQARTVQQRQALVRRLQQVAQATADPLEQYLALWLAAEVLAPVAMDQACQLVEQLAREFEFPVPEAKAQLAFAALGQAKESQMLEKLAPQLWDLADELAITEKLDLALRILRNLDTSLRKASLSKLSAETQQRIRNLRALEE